MRIECEGSEVLAANAAIEFLWGVHDTFVSLELHHAYYESHRDKVNFSKLCYLILGLHEKYVNRNDFKVSYTMTSDPYVLLLLVRDNENNVEYVLHVKEKADKVYMVRAYVDNKKKK